jgi:outer membrane lipoprotein-sorting protein
MSPAHLTLLIAGIMVSGIASASAQAPTTQLDRIEQKLDTVLHRLDQLRPG